MDIKDILLAYEKVGVSLDKANRRQIALYTARALAQAAIRKAGAMIVIGDSGTRIQHDLWYTDNRDLDVAYQAALEKISTGKDS